MKRPLRLRFDGVVMTDRLWFGTAVVGAATVQRRILNPYWEAGSQLYAAPEGWMLTLPRPRPVDTRTAAAVPLLAVRGRWATAPMRPQVALTFAEGAVVRLVGGKWQALGALQLVDPAQWLDLDELRWVEAVPLGDPPPPPKVVAAPLALDPRTRLGIGDQGREAALRVTQGLERGRQAAAGVSSAVGHAAQRVTAGLLRRVAGILRRLGGREASAERLSTSPSGGWGWATWLEGLAERLGLAGALSQLVSRQHAEYLQRMMAMFEQGHLAEALRHAIPLSSVPQAAPRSGWLSWLGPRPGLTLRAPGEARSSSIALGGDVFAFLKRMYRRAFEALDQQGQIREAAYVLSELLGEPVEAVRYLEKRDAYRLAAEFAETKKLEPGWVVLLWLRAGEPERAIALALRHGAFAAAVAGLERRQWMDVAAELRHRWAMREAGAGRHAAAAAIVWPLEAARPQARAWLQAAMTVPGRAGGQALARHAALCPESRELTEEVFRARLAAPGEDAALTRRAMLDTLAEDDAREARWLRRPLSRALVRDAVAHPSPDRGKSARRAVDLAGDGALKADLPRLPETVIDGQSSPWRDGQTLTLHVDAADVGTQPISDAAVVAGGRLVVALGELGVQLWTEHGREQRRFAWPTHRLVVTDDGLRLILMGRRGRSRWALARLDLVTYRLEPWADAHLDEHAPHFDGQSWLVSVHDRVMALDPLAPGLKALWSTSMEGAYFSIHVDDERLAVQEMTYDGHLERFVYRVPELTLASRRRVELWEDGDVRGPGAYVRGELHVYAPGVGGALVTTGLRDVAAVEQRGAWVAGIRPHAVSLIRVGGGTRAEWHYDHEVQHGVRLQPEWFVHWDDRGRVQALDLRHGTLPIDLRL